MHQRPYMKKGTLLQTDSDRTVSWRNMATYALLMVLMPFAANAQFIKIDIDIPAKTGVSDMETSVQSWQSDLNKSQTSLDGTYALTLSSAENSQILATLKHSDYLINAAGTGVKLSAVLAYRNDGKNKPPKENASDRVQFSMSDSGLLIDAMKDSPDVLYAYLMIYTSIELPKISGTTYIGEMQLTIEYN